MLAFVALAASCGTAPTITAVPIAPLDCDLEEVVDEQGQASLLRPVVSAGTGAAAATVIAGRSVSEPVKTVLVLCTQVTDGMNRNSGIGSTSVGPEGERNLTSDLGHRDDLMSARAGRAGPQVSRVELTLVSGATVRAIVAEGYWLAVWQGSIETERIVALDDAGKSIDSIEP